MIISAKLVKARVVHRCNQCENPIPVGEKKLRLYGAADYEDKPYVIYLHIRCWQSSDKKVWAILDESGLI